MNSNKYCVYIHTNKLNNKVYIGITKNSPSKRWKGGKGYLTVGGDFYNDIVKYGWDSFKHEILYTDLDFEEATRIEVDLISKYKSTNPKYGYNKTEGGRRGITGSGNGASKPVMAMKNGVEVARFECAADGARFVNGNRSNIINACKGRIKTAYGYQWRYCN